MRSFRFHPEAETEFLASVDWYAASDPTVGDDFNDAVEDAVRSIAELSTAWSPWPGRSDLRVRVLSRFPFSVVYSIESDDVVVIAVAHHRQRPGYWLDRLKP